MERATRLEPDQRLPKLQPTSEGEYHLPVSLQHNSEGQSVAVGVTRDRRTEAGLPDTDPGFDQNSTEAQQEHYGRAETASRSPDAASTSRGGGCDLRSAK